MLLPALSAQNPVQEPTPEVIPPAPQVMTVHRSPDDPTVTIVGIAKGTGYFDGTGIVEVAAPSGTFEAPVLDSTFAVSVDLHTNARNTIYVRTIHFLGARSAPATVKVTQDSEPPEISIQYPREGDRITSPTTSVCGTIRDTLTGFDDLRVFVNDVEATISVGVGNNGTYFAENVPLDTSGPTKLVVKATDAGDNTARKDVKVSYRPIPTGAPWMSIVSGNNQSGLVGEELLQPLVIQIRRAAPLADVNAPSGGEPFVDKLVLFRVTQSDGRLSATPGGEGALTVQAHTDEQGLARFYWRLGTDAGTANNRVEVLSRDIAGTTVFFASADSEDATQINVSSGNDQRVEVGGIAPEPLSVWLSDGCNGVANAEVMFTVLQGGGTVNGLPFEKVSTDATGHAEVEFMLGQEAGINRVVATYSGNLGSPAGFSILGVERETTQPTSFSGRVLDNAGRPVSDALCSLWVNSELVGTELTEEGLFRFDDVPSGAGHLRVDGSGAGSFPALEFEPFLIPNAENQLTAPILLPELDTENMRPYSTSDPTVLTVEGIEGLRMIIEPGSMYIGGEKAAAGVEVSLNQVHHDDVPMPMPDGAAPPFAWTLQPAGATFVPPIAIEYPNMSGLPPGAAAYFLSFNHGTGNFEIVAPGRVSDDGLTITSDPGTGLTLAGWGCACPPYSVTGACERDPEFCPGAGGDPNGDDQGGPDVASSDGPGDDAGEGSGDENDSYLGIATCRPKPKKGPCPNGTPRPCEPCPESNDGDKCTECEIEWGVADPVYLFSGEVYLEVEDFRIKGRGFDFSWKRKYRSQIPLDEMGLGTAQGYGWDFSYNITLSRALPGDVPGYEGFWMCNGRNRRDFFWDMDPADDVDLYTREEFFAELTPQPDGSYTLLFADRRVWCFRPLDRDDPAAGKIDSITDRNGNRMSFDYDALGRLVAVHDTLDNAPTHPRVVSIQYNADGFIESLTDFAGRMVRYEYYADTDSGGSFGDLKSVTTPSVTGTPNGNNFPNGKTTTYTYTKGFTGREVPLNHNLSSITDGRRNDPNDPTYDPANAFVANIYYPVTDPTDPLFDRIMEQVWGGNHVGFHYVPDYIPQTGDEIELFATQKTIVNDRVGNVHELLFNERNQTVVVREFTGRADPAAITTESDNRPTNKLRSTDPDFFETRYVWNENSRLRGIYHANGDISSNGYASSGFCDLDEYDTVATCTEKGGVWTPTTEQRDTGNLRGTLRHAGDHPNPGEQASIASVREYDSDFGGCCGFNFETYAEDAKGNPTLSYYDEDTGDRLVRINRIPSIVETFEYNEFGQMTARTLPDNGSGHNRRDEFIYYDSGPSRGYLWKEIVDAWGLALTTTYQYDLVGNVISEVDPRGGETTYVYNELDQVVQELSREVSIGAGVRYERDYFYDANDNLIRLDVQNIDAEGNTPANTHFTTTYEYEILNELTCLTEEVDDPEWVVTKYEYDGNRNRVKSLFGEASNGNQPTNTLSIVYDERDLPYQEVRAEGDPLQSTTQLDYDPNGNLIRRSEGVEEVAQISTLEYDSYDRLVREIDPMGNTVSYSYDHNSNLVRELREGELVDIPGVAGNVRLSEQSYVYDFMDRLRRTETEFFDAESQQAIRPSAPRVMQRIEYSDTSQIIRTINDNGHATETSYDGANRTETITDAKGNSVTYAYDPNSNITGVTELERSDLGGVETFTTLYGYDEVDRRTRTIDNAGNVRDFGYDSRNNLTVELDALRSSANEPGNRVEHVYDGLSRLIRTTRYLTDDGTGGGNRIGDITTLQAWDDSSRLVSQTDGQTDPEPNVTSYGYDPLDRRSTTTYADGTVDVDEFDVHDNVVRRTDANGTVVTCVYDDLDRLLSKGIVPGAGVSDDTTFEAYQYDGASRLVRAEDNDSVVTRSYDSMSNVNRETLNGQSTLSSYDGVGNLLSCTYPGGRVVECSFDELERKKLIRDQNGDIARYDYVGPSRVERREYGNGTRTEYAYDSVKRIVGTAHSVTSTGDLLDVRTYTWDAMYNKTSHDDELTGIDRSFVYDSVYRLIESERMPANVTVTYELDAVGNRNVVTGGLNPGQYVLDSALPPADRQMNQYTQVPLSESRTYDLNGNLIAQDEATNPPPDAAGLTYDYANRLVAYVESANSVDAAYGYDALGRRISATRTVGPQGPETTLYFYLGLQVCEEQSDANASVASYVYGSYIDDVLSMSRTSGVYYYHGDDMFSVMLLTDEFGSPAESYSFDDFGEPVDPATWQPIAGKPSQVGNSYLFTGRRYDSESDLYYYRTRYLDPIAGRFLSRDTSGIWGDRAGMGNGASYAGNNPATYSDPHGRQATCTVPERPTCEREGQACHYECLGMAEISNGVCVSYSCMLIGTSNNAPCCLPVVNIRHRTTVPCMFYSPFDDPRTSGFKKFRIGCCDIRVG